MNEINAARRASFRWASRSLTLFVVCGLATTNWAQQPEEATSDAPTAVTTADPQIPEDHLELLVKPLTKDDLVVEANAWRDLLKAKVQQIADVRIRVKEQQQTIQSAEDRDPQTSADESATGDESSSAEERKQELADSLAVLIEEKATLLDQLYVVVNELEAKGGEVEDYRAYTRALAGVGVDVTDTATAITVIKGWLVSEQGGQRWAWNIAKFLSILLAFYLAARIVGRVIHHAAKRVKGGSQLLVDFLAKFARQLLMIIGLIVALGALEVNITPLLAAIGAAGFVVGFALQGTLSNFASGMLILAYRPFDVGDVIEAAGVSGVVGSVSLFSTHIRTHDNKMMIVPNNDIWGGTITNATTSETRRVDMVFGIGYDDDIARAQEILEELVQQHELVLQDPPPVVRLHELADSSINFICRPWTKTGDYWAVYWDITRSVKEAFDQHGISIPFPQQDIHLHQPPQAATKDL